MTTKSPESITVEPVFVVRLFSDFQFQISGLLIKCAIYVDVNHKFHYTSILTIERQRLEQPSGNT